MSAINKPSDYWTVTDSTGTHKLYTPTSAKIEHTNVASSDSGRDTTGYMNITWIQNDVVKVSLTWAYMMGNELKNLIGWLQGKEFSFTYREAGTTKTVTHGYCGESSYEMVMQNYRGTGDDLYSNVSFNLIDRGRKSANSGTSTSTGNSSGTTV